MLPCTGQVFEGGSPVKANPLAWWEFQDCMEYLHRNGLERHPLHDQGYPSIGDVQSTVPVPESKWCAACPAAGRQMGS